jgi:DNA-binding CsgD family transcriptional regulator
VLGRGRQIELARIFPSLRKLAEASAGAGQGERYVVHQAVAALLELLAVAKPLVLALDDMQWADAASLELLAHLLRRPSTDPHLFAVAYRPGEAPNPLTSAVSGALRSGHLVRIDLRPLSEDETAEAMPGAVDDELREWLFRESGGNPFYAEQLYRTAASRSQLPVGGTKLDLEIPPAVAAALAGEVSSLRPDARRMLEGAAVAGDPFPLEIAAGAADLDSGPSQIAVDELLARELVQPTEAPRRFRFRHPIVRSAVYAGASPGWRTGAHARARDLLRGLGAEPIELAHHVEQSAAIGDLEAVSVLEAAGHAASQLAPGSAADWFAAALRLLGAIDTDRRLRVLVPMGFALGAAGRMAECRAALIEAIELTPAGAEDDRVGLITFLAAINHLLGNHQEARAVLRSALEVLPDPDSAAAVALQIELSADAMFGFDYDAMDRWSEMAFAGAEGDGRRALRVSAGAMRCLACVASGRIDEAERWRVSIGGELDSLPDQKLVQRLDAFYYFFYAEYSQQRYEDALGHIQRGIALSRSSGQTQFLPQMNIAEAMSLAVVGETAAAMESAQQALAAARLVENPQTLFWAHSVVSWVALAGGDLDVALREGESSVRIVEQVDYHPLAMVTRAHFGVVCSEAGDHERCLREMQAAGAPDFSDFYPERRPFWWEALARSAAGAEDHAAAEAWVARGEEYISDLKLPLSVAAIRRARARLELAKGKAQVAADLALSAASAQAARGARIGAARSRLLAGRALTQVDRDRGVAELEHAHAVLVNCGAGRWRDEAARELRRLGRVVPKVAPRKTARHGVEALSGREREIAELAAQAKTNREIAATLFISEKTVEKHLSKVFAKLGVRGRAAVGAKLAAPDEARRAQE